MALRAKKPEALVKRLKLFLFGPAGVGKSTAAIQFPRSYIIDCEKGTENYAKLIAASGSVVYQTTDCNEAIAEVKSLLTEKHDYRTLVIDPITTIYQDLLDKSEAKVGSDFGRHYGEANKAMKRLSNLIMALDMNVVVTAHAKAEYGPKLEKIGMTFDGWKRLDYLFDLVIELSKDKGKKNARRFGTVVKTRLPEQFPDGDTFEWSYDAIRTRYDAATLEREAHAVELASDAQLVALRELLDVVRVEDDWKDKCLSKAGVEDWADMPAEKLSACIKYLEGKLGRNANPERAAAPAVA